MYGAVPLLSCVMLSKRACGMRKFIASCRALSAVLYASMRPGMCGTWCQRQPRDAQGHLNL